MDDAKEAPWDVTATRDEDVRGCWRRQREWKVAIEFVWVKKKMAERGQWRECV
ncbi:hypothetical protein SESBI_37627 [Sesbania bispinosa]|nr:hypothetical protein SESBI_37627 [Sesbania bispinosa]